MLFITNRKVNRAVILGEGEPQNVTFDMEENAPSNSIHYCKRNSKNNYVEIGSNVFMQQLKESKAEQLVFYIHGFSNFPEPDIFPCVEKLQQLFDGQEKNLVKVIPLIWPCDNDFGIVKDYWDDQKSADMSGFSFSRMLEKFIQWRNAQSISAPCLKRINIIAHSMGNRVLRETLIAWDKYDLSNGIPLLFRNTFLVAADVVNESLEVGKPGELISHISRNVTVYHASDDLALRASKISNLKNRIASKRLGHSGVENLEKVPKNVYSIDCDNINDDYDCPIGHAYFLHTDDGQPGKVFLHMYNSVKTGRVKVSDSTLRNMIL